ncbi:MAG: transcription elongation factor GreA [Clostridiales bacterium]|nr:transcription elongation factor GreA [Clostridiales bacterium]MBQ2817241.1 transcription elongation factor GreA [Clostridia bacterium]MBQ4638531.1 transcription elongation factor GreA [Clostridia bacterium]
MTHEGLKALEEELEFLKTVKRQEVAERIKTAIAFGDISENAEYDEAKNEQAFTEGRIIQIENMLRVAQVVDADDISTDIVGVGNTVKVYDEEFDEELEYTIVGSAEANAAIGKVSNESPVGMALLGAKVGEVVSVNAPAGVIKLKVLTIER